MMKKIGLVVASLAALGVIFVGARTFACGDASKHKSASAATVDSKSCCPHGTATSKAMAGHAGCGTTSAQTASDGKASGYSCGSKGKLAGGQACGAKTAGAGHGCSANKQGTSSKASNDMASCHMTTSKAAYAANVYEVREGHRYAVAQGKKFEVTAETPYYELGNARYYFADKECMSRCAEKMASLAAELDKEAVSLATAEGNVTADNYGHKYGVCPVSKDKFLVTADSQVKVMDGQKYYVCSDKCSKSLMQPAIHTDTQTAQ